MGIRLGSGPDCCLEGGWSDFAFALRMALGSLGTPVAVVAVVELLIKPPDMVSRRLPRFKEGVRPMRG